MSVHFALVPVGCVRTGWVRWRTVVGVFSFCVSVYECVGVLLAAWFVGGFMRECYASAPGRTRGVLGLVQRSVNRFGTGPQTVVCAVPTTFTM